MSQFYKRLEIARLQAGLQGNPSDLCAGIDKIQALYESGPSGVDGLIDLLVYYAQSERVGHSVHEGLEAFRRTEANLRNIMEMTRLVHVALINVDGSIWPQIAQYYCSYVDDPWVGWWLVNTLSLRREPASRDFLRQVAKKYEEAGRAIKLLDDQSGEIH